MGPSSANGVAAALNLCCRTTVWYLAGNTQILPDAVLMSLNTDTAAPPLPQANAARMVV